MTYVLVKSHGQSENMSVEMEFNMSALCLRSFNGTAFIAELATQK